MSKEKENSNAFEDISANIIRYIFRNEEGITITPTARTKDGGYDIVVDCQIADRHQRIYFECKLREKNLNLRDIAANVIIAFNRGAAAFVALINHEFTEQTGDELARFSRKSVLTIKIVASTEIQQIISEGKISVSAELMELISEKKVNHAGDYELLKIDLKQNVLKQLLTNPSKRDCSAIEEISAFFSENAFEHIIASLKNRKTVYISGVWGSGAVQVAEAAEHTYTPQSILKIDACSYTTVQEVIIDLLAKTWAVPKEKIVKYFTKDQLEEITDKIDGIDNAPDTKSILKELLCHSDIDRTLQSSLNFIAAEYICKLFSLRQQNFEFLFFIENLQFAKKEVFDFLNYLFGHLCQNKFAGIILLREPEYLLEDTQADSQLKSLKKITEIYAGTTEYIELSPLTEKKAQQYILQAAPDLSRYIAYKLIKKVGTRFETLQFFIEQFKGKDERSIEQSITKKLQMITRNNPLSFFSSILPFYEYKYPGFFELNYICDCRVPYEFCSCLSISDEQLEELDQADLFQYDQGYLLPRNEYVKGWIMKRYNLGSIKIQRTAEKLRKAIDAQLDNYTTEKISIYRILKKYNSAFSILKTDICELSRNRQYTKLERELSLAVQMSDETYCFQQKAYYQIALLHILMIQKKLNSDAAICTLHELEGYIHKNSTCPDDMKMALQFFQVKLAFKKSQYSDNLAAVQQAKHTFQQCATGELTDNTGDWLGAICACYALMVKETQGNQKALKIFEKSLEKFPDSFELRREMLSHKACMELNKNPQAAYQNYQAIIALFSEEGAEHAALPFHEYGDCVMSLLLCRELEKAQNEATAAIKICWSNGILDEFGRNLNILGCIKICQGQYSQAKRLFHEAFSMLNDVECKLYAWRAALNYLQCCLMEDENETDTLLVLLDKTYLDFQELWLAKILELVTTLPCAEFQQTQEYRALLVFAFCYCRLTDTKSGLKKITDRFDLGNNKATFGKTLEQYLAGKDFLIDSPYVSRKFINILG